MDHPSEKRLTLSLSWAPGDHKAQSFELPVAPIVRALVVLGLCALSYKFGFWEARLEHEAAASAASIAPLAKLEPLSEATIGAGAPGQPAGQSPDLITPLNVRDPSALVMGPSSPEQVPPRSPEVPRARRR